MKHFFQTTALILVLVIFCAPSLANDQFFKIPKDMGKLLPAEADLVVGLSSLEDLDQLWFELLPKGMNNEEGSLRPMFDNLLGGFKDQVDPEKPLMFTAFLPPVMGEKGPYLTLLIPLKDKGQDLASVKGFEKRVIVRENNYVAVSSKPNWQPAVEKPLWAKNLKNGLFTASLDLENIIETNRFIVETGLEALETQAQNGGEFDQHISTEQMLALAQSLRSIADSVVSLELVLDHDREKVFKNFHFSTKPNSALASCPQPSFEDAFKMTRFLPGGEDLLVVSALDQTNQRQAFADYIQVSVRAPEFYMEQEAAQRHSQWYKEYLKNVDLSFLPNASTFRFEKDNSSFQQLIQSDNIEEDWQRIVHLIDGLHDLGNGFSLYRTENQEIDGHEVFCWTLNWQKDELQHFFDGNPAAAQTDTMMISSLMELSRFAPGNLYMAQIDDYILECGGSNPAIMKQLIQNVNKNKGQIDPSLKKAVKSAGPGLQMASAGDLNKLIQVALEIAEDFDNEREYHNPFPGPLPFLMTMEIDSAEYLIHMEMEKPVLRKMVKTFSEEQ